MKILFLTNVPSPYRVDFFNLLGQKSELTVLFEKATSDERDESWKKYNFENFEGIILPGFSLGVDKAFCPSAVKYIKEGSYDHIICTDFSTPTGMYAIQYMKNHRIQYWLESDGGFAKNGKGIKEIIKKHFIQGATGYFSTAKEHDLYYLQYGAEPEKIHRYPFTSIKREDILPGIPTRDEKRALRSELDIGEQYCIISVGRFSYENGRGKRFDLLFHIAEKIEKNIGIYIIGDNPTQEFIDWKEKCGLSNVHFIDFKLKNELFKWYRAADLFILLSKGEAWGLVVNEAMANGLPVITTDKCIAGLEMIEDGKNGFIVPMGDYELALKHINRMLSDEDLLHKMANESLKKAASYTIEEMSNTHEEILCRGGYRTYIRRYSRSVLNISEEVIVLSVGQFVYRKGFDVLIRAMNYIDRKIGVYIVGGTPTEEYIALKNEFSLNNLHFVGFKRKEDLKQWFLAADIFVHPTREDIWGLVINEAMSYGLPVITTRKCVAGLELIEENKNGLLVEVDDSQSLAECINSLFSASEKLVDLGRNNTKKIMMNYTINSMVDTHLSILGS